MSQSETFVLEVKNVNCNFDSLRDKLERISPSFTLDKDTFIFHAATTQEESAIRRLSHRLASRNLTIIVQRI